MSFTDLKIHVVPGGQMIVRGSASAVGFDLTARTVELVAELGGVLSLWRVNLGVVIAVPEGYEGSIRNRSSAAKNGWIVQNGTLDPDYRGELKGLIWVVGDAVPPKPGDRVCQIVFSPVVIPVLVSCSVEDMGETARGTGSEGSTGKTIEALLTKGSDSAGRP